MRKRKRKQMTMRQVFPYGATTQHECVRKFIENGAGAAPRQWHQAKVIPSGRWLRLA